MGKFLSPLLAGGDGALSVNTVNCSKSNNMPWMRYPYFEYEIGKQFKDHDLGHASGILGPLIEKVRALAVIG